MENDRNGNDYEMQSLLDPKLFSCQPLGVSMFVDSGVNFMSMETSYIEYTARIGYCQDNQWHARFKD